MEADDERIASLAASLDAKELEERFFGLFEDAPDGIILIDSTGAIIVANVRIVEIFGYSRPELVGKTIDILVPEDKRAQHAAHRDAYFSRPKKRSMGANMRIQGRRKDGTTIPLDIAISYRESKTGLLGMAYVRELSDARE